VGGYVLGASIHRVAGPIGWTLLAAALVCAIVAWRYYKQNEERLLAEAERAMQVDQRLTSRAPTAT
jgi:hypothetical protein